MNPEGAFLARAGDGAGETGMNLDLDDLEPFLFRVSSVFESGGFDSEKIRSIVRSVERQRIDSEREFFLKIFYSGICEPLRITVFMDDVDAPDVSFFGSPDVIRRIEAEIRKFVDEQGTGKNLAPFSEPDRSKLREEIQARSRAAATPVLEALNSAGAPVVSLADPKLVGGQYPAAKPVLLEWLLRTNYTPLKWGIAKILTAPWARPIPRRGIVLAFEGSVADKGYEFSAKWQLGDLIRQIAPKSVLDEMIRVVKDKHHGRAREMIALGLGKIKDERAVDALLALLQDNDLVGHSIEGLGALKAPRAIPAIKPFLHDPTGWVRRAAKSAITKIEKHSPSEE
jgi:hypothetical protein